MSILLLRLAAPLQSWGGASRYSTRGTLRAPTKSGVAGLLACALGRPRDADLTDLAQLRFAVRLDQPGRLLVDYHTVSGASHAPDNPAGQTLPTADGKRLEVAKSTKVTPRQYLTDAVFVAALQGDDDLLQSAAAALVRPRYPLFLGRRSCPPARRILISMESGDDLEQALATLHWQAGPRELYRRLNAGEHEVRLDVIIDDPAGHDSWQDVPLPAAPYERRFARRPIRHTSVRAPIPGAQPPQPHDPMSLLA